MFLIVFIRVTLRDSDVDFALNTQHAYFAHVCLKERQLGFEIVGPSHDKLNRGLSLRSLP